MVVRVVHCRCGRQVECRDIRNACVCGREYDFAGRQADESSWYQKYQRFLFAE